MTDFGEGDEIMSAHAPQPASPKPREASGDRIVIVPSAPYDVAKEFGMRRHMTPDGLRTLHHHRSEFFASNGASFQPMDAETVRSTLYAFLAECWERDGEGKLHKVKPKSSLISNVEDALRAAAQLDNRIEPPVWLSEGAIYKPSELVVCANTMLHWPTNHLVANTPSFFTTNALEFDYRPDLGAEPMQWLRFLADLWADDNESIDTLQEIFGLLLTPDTSFQKIFMLIGPKRSGKGTIARVLARLIGKTNTVSPTLSSLGGNFGLQPLIHKTAAIIGDARIGPKTDTAAVAERLLSVSGEDLATVDRKFLGSWTGQLGVRFVIISNELPRFSDVSGALASRFVILSLRNSFLGKEDLGLLDRLLPELPKILNWAIIGLKRLKARGYFQLPASSREQMEELDTMASPMNAFLRDTFEFGDSSAGILVDEFCDAWRNWCKANGRDHAGTNQSIGLALRTAAPHVSTQQLRTGDPAANGSRARQRWFLGIRYRRE